MPNQTVHVRPQRRGSVLAYLSVCMFVFVGVCSLAVDYGHVQVVKAEMQRCADATARGYLVNYNMTGSRTYTSGSNLYSSTRNPTDANSGITPTTTVTWGYWDSATKTFNTVSGTTVALKVTISRNAANNNAVPLVWASVLGFAKIGIQVNAIAALTGSQSVDINVPATANPYLAGMPSGTSTVWGDNTAANGAFQVPSIPVTPGTWITITNTGGTSSVVPGSLPFVGPDGNAAYARNHGQNWDDAFNSPGPENGIGDAVMPEDSLMGVFLGRNSPDTNPPPAFVDWTSASVADKPTYSNIVIQQPFYIGTGQTSGGIVQQFQVPKDATRLFIGVWDGVCWSNNGGAVTGTINLQNSVQLVQ